MPPHVPATDLAARLAPLELVDADGTPVRLGDLGTDRSALLVHLRHFG